MRPVHQPRYLRHSLTKPGPGPSEGHATWLPAATVLVSVLALLGTLFYWMQRNAGRVYREAYLQTFGFRADALPWGTDDRALLGYITQAKIIVLLLALIAAMILIGLLSVIFVNFLTRRSPQKTKAYDKAGNKIITPQIAVGWAMVIAIAGAAYFIAMPLVLFKTVEKDAIFDAERQISAIQMVDLDRLKELRVIFVEITRDKGETVSGAAISCSEKFCALYSPQGPVHARIVPLSDVKTWSKLEWADLGAQSVRATAR